MSAVLDSGHKNVYLGERVWLGSQLGLELGATNIELEKKLCAGLIEAVIADAELGLKSGEGNMALVCESVHFRCLGKPLKRLK